MNDFYKSDVFFFISSVAVIIIAVLLIIFIVYLIRVIRDVKAISTTAKEETQALAQDIDNLRAKTKRQGFKLASFFTFFLNIFRRKKKLKR